MIVKGAYFNPHEREARDVQILPFFRIYLKILIHTSVKLVTEKLKIKIPLINKF